MTEPAPGATSPPRARSPSIALVGRIGPDDADCICERLRATANRSAADPLTCDVGAVIQPDVGTVDALARMALSARRIGRTIELLRVAPDLRELLVLVGLVETVGCADGLAVEVVGEAEEREEPGGVEEEDDPADPIA